MRFHYAGKFNGDPESLPHGEHQPGAVKFKEPESSKKLAVVAAVIGMIPMAVFHIALGLLCGSLLGVKQVGGLCGALLTNLSSWLSGVWFDLTLVGGVFEKRADVRPFVHAVKMAQALYCGDFGLAGTHLLPVLLYGVLITAAAVLCFLKQRKEQ